MPHLIKKSHNKLIISGLIAEHIHYEKGFYYNFPPKKKSLGLYTEDKPENPERRNDNIIKSRSRLRRLIQANTGITKYKMLFLTYTFAENIESPTDANKEWSLYVKRLNYYLKNKGFEKAQFVTVIEFQKRGAVHYHTLYFNIPYIPFLKEDLATIWGLGFIKLISLDSVNNVPAYVSKYLRKGLVDKRLRNKKAFFSSRNLLRPLFFRNNVQVQNMVSDYVKKINVSQYDSIKYGVITHTSFEMP